MALNHLVQKQKIWLTRVLANAWHNLMRNKLLTIATTFIIALMFFVFNLMLAFSFAADSIIDRIGERFDMSVEIQENVEPYTIQTFIETLEKHSAVKDVIFINRDEALQKFGGKYPHVISFLDHHNLENPLPNVVRVVSKGVEENNNIIEYLESARFKNVVNQDKLSKNEEQKSRNEKILNITQFIQGIGLWLNLIFALVALMIIFNSINLNINTHKHEIHIMQLVGAKHHFIRGGFLFEGIFYATSALIISLIFSRIVLSYLTKNLLGIISNESLLAGLNAVLVYFEDRFFITLSWQLLAAILAGLISSYLAIELYLRKKSAL